MRKRLVIAAIIAVVIGVAAYVLTDPRKGSMEYHKRKFLEEREKLKFSRPWERMLPDFVRKRYLAHRYNVREFHHRALIDGGYLKEAPVATRKPLSSLQAYEARSKLRPFVSEDNLKLIVLRRTDTNAVVVIAPPNTFDRLVAAIRDAEAANSQ